MAIFDIKETSSDIRVNVGCGLSFTSARLSFDNSFSVHVARWPIMSSAPTRMGFLATKSTELAEVPQRGSVRYANAATRISYATGSAAAVDCSHMIGHLDRTEARAFLADAAVTQPGSTRIAEPEQLDPTERATESVYV